MKRSIVLGISLILLLVGQIAMAQPKKEKIKNLEKYDFRRLHFGFALGVNRMNFDLRYSDDFLANTDIFSVQAVPSMGFQFGIHVGFGIAPILELRAQGLLSFGQHSLQYKVLSDTTNGIRKFKDYDMNIENTNLEIPILLRIKALRKDNHRHYMLAGISPRIDWLAGRIIQEDEDAPLIGLKGFDLAYDIGYGIDFYLPYFKFSTELKYSVGLKNMLDKNNNAFPSYTSVIDRLNARTLMVSLNFEY